MNPNSQSSYAIKSFNEGNFAELIKIEAIKVAEQFKKESEDKINKNSQIRNFYDELQSVMPPPL